MISNITLGKGIILNIRVATNSKIPKKSQETLKLKYLIHTSKFS